MINVIRVIGAVVLGYAIMVLLISVVQEIWLGGIGWNKSSLGVLALGGTFTCLSGAISAASASAVSQPTGRAASRVMAFLIVVETTFLISNGTLTDPLWFDMLASGSLLISVLLGGEIFWRLNQPTTPINQPATPIPSDGSALQ